MSAYETGDHELNRDQVDYDLLDTLSHLLRRSHFYAEALFAKQLGDYEVTSRQLALLVAVAQNPGASQRTIGDMIALDMNTISDMLRRMDKRELVERHASVEDGRSISIHLGNKSVELLTNIQDDALRYQELLSDALSDEEAAILKTLLRKLLGLTS